MCPGAAAGEAEEESEWEEESWDARRARLLSYRVPEEPEQEPRWELVASTLEQFEDFAAGFEAGGHPTEVQFAQLVCRFVSPGALLLLPRLLRALLLQAACHRLPSLLKRAGRCAAL